MSDLISVVVPVYNVGRYLPRCLESIINQTYKNIEIILVNDGSTDNSLEICEHYALTDNRIKVINKENGGLSSARNTALDIAGGEYIAFVDSDDWIRPRMLSTLMDKCKASGADMAICGIGSEHPPIIREHPIIAEKDELNPEELIFEYLTAEHILYTVWNKLYHASLFDSLRFTKGVIYEDVFIMHELLGRCKKAVLVKECFYVHCVRQGSITTSSFSEKNLDSIKAFNSLYQFTLTRFPQYAYIAESKVINRYAALMRKIIAGNGYFKYKSTFEELYFSLKKGYAEYVSRNKNTEFISVSALLAVRSKNRFIIQTYIKTHYILIRNTIWSALFFGVNKLELRKYGKFKSGL